MVEKLYRKKWSAFDGLGALILVPTRELAIQAFEVLKQFANLHDLSAGIIIGGKKVQDEKERIRGMNILVATPGRLLQHMNETMDFDYEKLQILAIDEVDRILDMGFKETIDQIMSNVPNQSQKILVSATVGKNLKQITRMNLDPKHEFISIHDFDSLEQLASEETADMTPEERLANEKFKSITPMKLVHHYMLLKIEDKLDTLFSFLKSH